MSNGCEVDINETGTRLVYKPGTVCVFHNYSLGFINGGKYTFNCGTERGIGYYLMGILPLAIFGKIPTKIVFSVCTHTCNIISRELQITRLILV